MPAGSTWKPGRRPLAAAAKPRHQPRVKLPAPRGHLELRRGEHGDGVHGERKKKKKRKERKRKGKKGGGEPRVLKTKRWCPLAGTWGRSRKMAPASLCPEGHPPWRPPDTHASRSLPFRPALQDQQMSLSPRTAESLYGRLAGASRWVSPGGL